MKKLLNLALLLSLGTGVYAESSLQILSIDGEMPGPMDPPFLGLDMSPNGKFITGCVDMGAGVFIANRETGEIVWKICGRDGGETRGVDNNGLAIGFMDYTELGTPPNWENQGYLYSFENEDLTFLPIPSGYKKVIGEGLTTGGKILIGTVSQKNYSTKGAYKKEGEDWILLPDVNPDDLGLYKGHILEGDNAAKQISADGKVIAGNISNFMAPTVWIRNDKGEYEMDFFPGRFLGAGDNDITAFTAMYGLNMSNNGKYVLTMVQALDDAGLPCSGPAVYNTETKEIKLYNNPQPVDEGEGLYPMAIANDGTIIGTIGKPYFGSYGSFIIKSGETVAQTFNEAFPEYAETLGLADTYGFAMPTAISADGRYIMGYTYYSEDYMDPNSFASYVTFVIDRGEEYSNAAVDEISYENVEPMPEAIYTIDGRRVNKPEKGLNIIRMSDGSARKVIIK